MYLKLAFNTSANVHTTDLMVYCQFNGDADDSPGKYDLAESGRVSYSNDEYVSLDGSSSGSLTSRGLQGNAIDTFAVFYRFRWDSSKNTINSGEPEFGAAITDTVHDDAWHDNNF